MPGDISTASSFNQNISNWDVTNVGEINHYFFATNWGSGNTEPNWN